MNERSINEQYTSIQELIVKKRLKEAMIQLESFLWNCPEWNFRTRVEQINTSYNYMLDYMQQGAHDPQRSKLHNKMIADIWEIADHARLKMLDGVSYHYYHATRNTPLTEDAKGYDLRTLMHILESFDDDMAVSSLISDNNINSVLERHESTLRFMFLQTWTNSAWTSQDEEQAKEMLVSETLPVHDLCLFVSALTLSLMECFDLKKLLWMLDAYQHPNVLVAQRALVGFVIAMHIYRNRISLYPELRNKTELLSGELPLEEDITCIYRQLLLCQETEKIDKKMREEIIPEMLKNVSMHNTKFGSEETDEENDDKNPDWENMFGDSALGDKLREMNELQLEGADVYMSTFSALKGYSFFNDIQNWFYPFDKRHSSVIKVLKNEKETSSMLDIILQSGLFSNSDKYSIFQTIVQLPKPQRDMMLSQLTEQQMETISEQSTVDTIKKMSERPSTVSNQYLHDLYRFFKLNVRRFEFHDIFKDKLDIHHIPILDNLINSQKNMYPIASFYVYKERWNEASELFKELEVADSTENDITPEFYQQMGYALQKEKKYDEAIAVYSKADAIKADNVWTNRQLATCYRLSKNYAKALIYLRKVEEVLPENRNVLFHIGSCLAESGQYEEAIQSFFKLDFLDSSSIKAWRGIGWCSFMLGKQEQAMKYYEKVIGQKPIAIDYVNAGHVAWAMDNVQKAVSLYGESILLLDNKQQFLDIFEKDEDILVKQGIPEEDIPLMKELVH